MATVDVDVLGPLRVTVDGVERRLGGRRERAVLSMLAAADGRPVAADRIVDELWGDDAPPSASGSLQVAISRLRAVLEPDRPSNAVPGVLVTLPGGYALAAAAVSIDAVAFTGAVDDLGDHDPARRLAVAVRALKLWRGEPYADLLDVPTLAAEATRLAEARLHLVEVRADALLALGRHDQVGPLLSPLVDVHPFRERMWSLLALALYRCDRQADALETLRRLRAHLRDELGVDPSTSVRELEQHLLAQADHLRAPTTHVERRLPPDVPRSPGVVGREDLLADIERLLGRVVDDGAGGVLLLTGEAGIGKTVVASELARTAVDRGARLAWGRCHEADVAPAYWPWLPVLRELAGPDPAAEVALLLGAGADRTPELVDAAAAALRTYDAVTRVLRSAAAQGPLVVVLEDVHWADVSSLRLLTFAAEALSACAVLLVATVRDVGTRPAPALTEALAGLARLGAVRVRVPGVTARDVGELVDGVLGRPDDSLAAVLARRTDGNPFFVLEMARLLAAADEATAEHAEDLRVPDGVADVLRLRVQRLGDGSREALAAASVAGRTFDAALVAQVTERDVAQVLDALDEALAYGVVNDDDTPGPFRFVHALTRETVYGDLPPGRRCRLHAKVGSALAARLGHDTDLLAQVAHHHSRAAALLPEAAEPAVRYGEAAAAAAEARGAFSEALDLWTGSLETERRVPVADAGRRHRVLLGLATARQRLGDLAGMRAALDEAVTAARADGDWRRMAQAATSFRGSGVWHWREFGTTDEAMVDVLRTCLDHVDDLELRARLLASLQMEHTFAWRSAEADRCGTRSLELARELRAATGDTDTLRDALVARELSLWGPGTAGERERAARESLALPLSAEHEMAARFQLASALHHQGLSADADREMGRALELSATLRHTGCDVPLAWWRWMRAVETMAPDAGSLADRALAMHRRTSVVGLLELTGHAAVVSAPEGSDVAPDVVASARDHPNPAYRAVVAWGLARAGRFDDAVEMLGEPTPDGSRDYASLFAACLRVDVLAGAGRADHVQVALARITRYTDEVATYGSVDSLGSVSYFVGRGLWALGDVDGARAHLERAVEANRSSGCRRWELFARQELEQPAGGKAAATAG